MCIIIIKPKGVELPPLEILENCFNYNRDGAGYAYYSSSSNNKNVHIRKGYMNFNSLMQSINTVDNIPDTTMIIHFRISTSGKVDKGNCHPYPINSKGNMLRQKKVDCKMAMAHNGILSNYTNYDSQLNDTQLFIQNTVSLLYMAKGQKMFNDNHINTSLDILRENSRLAFMDNQGRVHKYGEWECDCGCFFSNTSYLSHLPALPKAGYKSYDYDYDYDYGYDYDTLIDDIIYNGWSGKPASDKTIQGIKEYGFEIDNNLYDLDNILIEIKDDKTIIIN